MLQYQYHWIVPLNMLLGQVPFSAVYLERSGFTYLLCFRLLTTSYKQVQSILPSGLRPHGEYATVFWTSSETDLIFRD